MGKSLNLDKEYLELYDKGINDTQIALKLGIAPSAAHNIRKRLNLSMNFKYTSKINYEDLKRLWEEGKNDREIGIFFNLSNKTVGHWRRKFNLSTNYKSDLANKPTDVQRQIIIGGLLGDSSMSMNRHARLVFTHSLAQEEYAKWKENQLESLGTSNYYREFFHKVWKKTFYSYNVMVSTNIYLDEFYEGFYKDSNNKRVQDYYIDELEPLGLAIWFMDDGYYHNSGKTFGLSTNSFSESEKDLIMLKLKDKFNLEFTKHKSGIIYLKGRCAENFSNLIRPYIHPCISYKLGVYEKDNYLPVKRNKKYERKQKI